MQPPCRLHAHRLDDSRRRTPSRQAAVSPSSAAGTAAGSEGSSSSPAGCAQLGRPSSESATDATYAASSQAAARAATALGAPAAGSPVRSRRSSTSPASAAAGTCHRQPACHPPAEGHAGEQVHAAHRPRWLRGTAGSQRPLPVLRCRSAGQATSLPRRQAGPPKPWQRPGASSHLQRADCVRREWCSCMGALAGQGMPSGAASEASGTSCPGRTCAKGDTGAVAVLASAAGSSGASALSGATSGSGSCHLCRQVQASAAEAHTGRAQAEAHRRTALTQCDQVRLPSQSICRAVAPTAPSSSRTAE